MQIKVFDTSILSRGIHGRGSVLTVELKHGVTEPRL